MERLKMIVLCVIAILLVVFITDRVREPEQLGAIHERLGQNTQALQQAEAQGRRLENQLSRLEVELARTQGLVEGLQQGLRSGVSLAPTTGNTQNATSAPVTSPDGYPVQGRNFLLPHDPRDFDPSKLGGTRYTFADTPNRFNPITSSSATASDAESLVNDALTDRHPERKDRFTASLATSCVITDDWKTFTFTLRPHIPWQRPVIADRPEFAWIAELYQKTPPTLNSADFALTLQMIQDPAVDCPALKAYFADVDRVETPDPLTVIVHWKASLYSNVDATLSLTPLPRHIFSRERDGSAVDPARLGASFNDHWFDQEQQLIGVGNYRMVENIPDKRVVFERDPGYWGGGLHFARIIWDAEVREGESQLTAFKNDQVQVLGLTPTQFRREILDRGDERFPAMDPNNEQAGRAGPFAWERIPSRAWTYIGWNLRLPIFQDVQVRHALAYAFPKERIIREVLNNLGRPQIGPEHLDNPGHNHSLVDYRYNPQRARELLSAAGWTDSDGDNLLDKEINGARVPLRFVVKYYANSPEWDSTLLIYREELRALGIGLEARPLEWKSLLDAYERCDFEAVVGAWRTDGLDLDYRQLWHSESIDQPGSSNLCGFRNARVDELCVRLRQTFDTEERRAIAGEIQAIIQAESPYLFICARDAVIIWHTAGASRVEGIPYGLDHYHPLYRTTPLRWWLPK